MADAFADEDVLPRAGRGRSAPATEVATRAGKAALRRHRRLRPAAGRLDRRDQLHWPSPAPPRRAATRSCVLGEKLFLKAYRRLQAGDQPRARDRPLPHRRRGLPALRAGGGRARVRRRRRHRCRRSRCCRATSRTRATAGRHARLPRALPRATPRGGRSRPECAGERRTAATSR